MLETPNSLERTLSGSNKVNLPHIVLPPLRRMFDSQSHHAPSPLSCRKVEMKDERRILPMSEPTKEELLARIAELEKQSGSKKSGKIEFRVGEKGGVSVYGLGRFPVTLYYEQWNRLLDTAVDLRAFLELNKSRLKLKNETCRAG